MATPTDPVRIRFATATPLEGVDAHMAPASPYPDSSLVRIAAQKLVYDGITTVIAFGLAHQVAGSRPAAGCGATDRLGLSLQRLTVVSAASASRMLSEGNTRGSGQRRPQGR
jgi:hypothetical protein